jgi:DNA-binding transcriptional regulator YiaG
MAAADMTGAELRAWREHWQLTQGQLADMLGVRLDTVGRWERLDRGIPPYLPLALETLSRRIGADLIKRAKGPART